MHTHRPPYFAPPTAPGRRRQRVPEHRAPDPIVPAADLLADRRADRRADGHADVAAAAAAVSA